MTQSMTSSIFIIQQVVFCMPCLEIEILGGVHPLYACDSRKKLYGRTVNSCWECDLIISHLHDESIKAAIESIEHRSSHLYKNNNALCA